MLPLEAVFQALNDRGARYVLVGGLAVVLHGHLRATGDVDLIVDLGAGEVEKTLIALETAGFRPYAPVAVSDFADPEKRAAWVRDKGMLVFSLRPEAGVPMVDLFLEHPIPFDELWVRSVVTTLRGVPIRVASIDDLVRLKRTAGRPEDLTDAEALLEIKRIQAEGTNP
jgi:predicted nucleotidyltransferase